MSASSQSPARGLESIPGVCEISVFPPARASTRWVLIEIPHGATRRADYDRVALQLKSRLPDQLEHFFFVNTDVGAPEGAAFLGRSLSSTGVGVVTARCLIPRTFIDTNRVIAKTQKGVVVDGLTPGVPGYIEDPQDCRLLEDLHASYHRVVDAAYRQVCGAARGLALQLHSYAPRSVGIEKTDAGIVRALHAAYVPEVYATWPLRPPVDLICATADGSFRCSPRMISGLRAAYAEAGIKAEENATYHLHPATMGLVYAQQYPDRVICVELNRDLVADPFTPFGVSPISAAKVERMTAPIGKVLTSNVV